MDTYRVAGINFDHMHMGDLLRQVNDHPNAEIVGICDERAERMSSTVANFQIPRDRQFTDYRECIEKSRPDIVILCPSTGRHAEYVEKVAPFGVNILVEKPFASSLKEADRMIAAIEKTGKTMVINWPLAWYPPHVTSKRLIDEGVIGDVLEVHYYDGNRGPLHHLADKVETQEEVAREKSKSWWYQRSEGGGSLQDYLGYGVTLGTWFQGGRAPIEVTCMVDQPQGLQVDEHSITIARYGHGLSKYETRWGTFTDPWTHRFGRIGWDDRLLRLREHHSPANSRMSRRTKRARRRFAVSTQKPDRIPDPLFKHWREGQRAALAGSLPNWSANYRHRID
jgi:predicted dehydrogenase